MTVRKTKRTAGEVATAKKKATTAQIKPTSGNNAAATQKWVGAIWKDLLATSTVGADSDFFDMGGDSILALNMLFEVGEELGIELPPSILYEHSRFGHFCAAIDSIRKEENRALRL